MGAQRRSRRRLRSIAAVMCSGAALSCNASVASPPPKPPTALPRSQAAQVAAPPAYRVAASALSQNERLAPQPGLPDGGGLFSHRRVTAEGQLDLVSPPLDGGLRAPASAGGGWLFWGNGQLYRADTFLGSLRPLAASPSIDHVSFGPGFLLVSGSGERLIIDGAGALRPVSPLGLSEIVSTPDGRVLAAIDGGRLSASTDGGQHFVDVTAQLGAPPTDVRVVEDAPWASTATAALRLEKDGHFERFSSLPRSAPRSAGSFDDARWTLKEPPLERALRVGAPIDEHHAVVEASGAIARVNLDTGALEAVSPRLLPDSYECDALRVPGGEVLVACRRSGAAALVVSGASAGQPLIEAQLPESGQFSAASTGALAYTGGCSASQPWAREKVCQRQRDGKWTEFDATPALQKLSDKAPPQVLRWVPGDDGAGLAVIWGESMGFLHTPSAAVDLVPEAQKSEASSLVNGYSSSPGVIDRTWSLATDGSIHVWHDGNLVLRPADGSVVRSPFHWSLLLSAGARAFARDAEQRAWQTLDFGTTWNEVLAPPLPQGGGAQACSDAGCHLGQWLRVGWQPTAPAPPAELPRPPPNRSPAPLPRPRLTCAEAGPPKVTQMALPVDGNGNDAFGFGARKLPVLRGGNAAYYRIRYPRNVQNPSSGTSSATGLRAMMHAHTLALSAAGIVTEVALNAPRDITFVEAFDPAATVSTASHRLAELVSAAAHARGPQPSPDVGDGAELVVVPVLGRGERVTEGLLLDQAGPYVWVTGSSRARTLPLLLALEGSSWIAQSAIARGVDRLAVLVSDGSGTLRAIDVGRGGFTRLFELPPPVSSVRTPIVPDALAEGPAGELAVIRLPSGRNAPSPLDPALLLREGRAPEALASWSTLRPASAPECKADTSGFRALIQTQAPWVELHVKSTPGPEDTDMMAVVRWSATAVCLEAIELTDDPYEMTTVSLTPRIVARFGAKPEAGRVGIDEGIEVRQPLTCALEAPPG